MKTISKKTFIEFAKKTCSPLKKWIANVIIDEWDNYDDPEKLFEDMFNDAVSNGLTPLIYNSDFEEFFNNYKIEISIILGFTMEEIGTRDPRCIFTHWDTTDPLAVGTQNKFILCSFAFEYGLEHILDELKE